MKPNVILIVCDTLRKDIIDLYGGPAKAPCLKELADDSMLYGNCIAPAPWTFPSHVSMFSGMYPSRHGMHESSKDKMAEIVKRHISSDYQTLAQYMKGEGYSTYGVSANLMISKLTGFGRGFDKLHTFAFSPWIQSDMATQARNLGADPYQVVKMLIKGGKAKEIAKYGAEYVRIKLRERQTDYPRNKGAEEVNRNAESFVKDDDKPFFLFMNYYEAHEPYKKFSDKETQDHLTGIKPIDQSKVEYLKRQYIMEAEYLDGKVGEFINWLKDKKLYDDSLIILTSDHGQAFNEHGFMYHGIYLYDEVVRVPLIIKYPGNKKLKNKEGYQSLTDIFGLVKDVVHGKNSDITRDVAFSEVFGNAEFFPESYKHRMWYVKKNYERVRAAVYMDGYKLNADGSEGKIDEFMMGEGHNILENDKRNLARLVSQLKQFRKGEKFLLPKIE